MSLVVLSTINARYVHAALGIRYLRANMGALQPQTRLAEFVLGARPADIAESLLALKPRIVGFGVYIWNTADTTRVVALLKRVAPELVIVVGGPEVSHEVGEQPICQLADYVVTGWGDVSFPALCRAVLDGAPPQKRVIAGVQPPLAEIALPYELYTDEDIAKRFLYVEASRGCPFKCEFCLSALDKTAWPFDLDAFMRELERLHARGARHFRFVDRTFNLKVSASLRILEFFLERLDERLFLHFEVIPDHLPEKLKAAIARFPAGSLQFEVGIQTWNPEVQALISRRQDNRRAEENLAWLRQHSNALVHVDLIAGLPGEDLESFGRGFDRLYALRPHEIQVGILKRLRGTAIARHTAQFDMRYNPDPPYNVLATDRVPFADMQRIARFARYWDLVGNSGRFRGALSLIVGEAGSDSAFARFMRFADWLYACTGKTHEIALERLAERVLEFLATELELDPVRVAGTLKQDYEASGARGRLPFVTPGDRVPGAPAARRRLRQARHILNGHTP
ncbi:MAG TPA: DUF4080 domain-containing protein [Burkholderiales bacterium]|jgi:radical SAM superfamily enzyme YgiQ (UPF0313 family)|nr:DUF4080 domain-containing protein [Burkholderiales bacterium]